MISWKALMLVGSLSVSGLLGSSVQAQGSGVDVKGVIEVGRHVVTKERPYFILLRDVCTKEDIEVVTSRTFKNVSTGKLVSPSRYNSGHYGYHTKGECYPVEFRIAVNLDEFEEGSYIYQATGVIRGKDFVKFIDLPSETILIKK